jgi:Xaa-Pro dipeptidase
LFPADHEPIFRQNSHFFWAFGVNRPDFAGVIHVDDGTATLLMPRLSEAFAVWMGAIETPAQIVEGYGTKSARYTDETEAVLASLAPSKIFVNVGVNTDSGAATREPSLPAAFAPILDRETLFPLLTETRAVKTERELAVMRHVIGAASDAHCVMMRAVRSGVPESMLESVFRFWIHAQIGARLPAYTYICGSGSNAAILHYGHSGAPNDRVIQDGDIVLCDCGNELYGYASDITTTFPASGTFSPEQRVIYQAVLSES